MTSVSEWYDGFAVGEAAGHSPSYERLARAVAGNAEIIDRLDTLPESKRQPNLAGRPATAFRHQGVSELLVTGPE